MAMEPITEREAAAGLIWPAAMFGAFAAAATWWMSMLGVPLAVMGGLFAIANAWRIGRRRAFSRALLTMKPLDELEHDPEELFPDEIDPETAQPDTSEVYQYLFLQVLVGGGLWLALHWIANAVG